MSHKSNPANGVPSQPSSPTGPPSPTRDNVSQKNDLFVDDLRLSPAHDGWSPGSGNIRAFTASSSESPSLSHQKIALQGWARLNTHNKPEKAVLKTDQSESPKLVVGSMYEGGGVTVSNVQKLPVEVLGETKTPEKNEAVFTSANQATIYQRYTPVLADHKSSLDSIHDLKGATDHTKRSSDLTSFDSKYELTDVFVSVTVEDIDRAADAVIPPSQCMTVSDEDDIVFGIPAMVSSDVYRKLEKAEYVTGMLPYP